MIAHRAAHLTAYQDTHLAEQYRARVARIRALGDDALTRSVATQYARLLAPKDEYEVARLYAETDFLASLGERFDGQAKLSFHLAPPLFAKPGPDRRPKKIAFGPWLLPVLKLLAKARGLRGSWLDPFRHTPEKQLDHLLLADYEADLDLIESSSGDTARHRDLAAWPGDVRGFGGVRQAAANRMAAKREELRRQIA